MIEEIIKKNINMSKNKKPIENIFKINKDKLDIVDFITPIYGLVSGMNKLNEQTFKKKHKIKTQAKKSIAFIMYSTTYNMGLALGIKECAEYIGTITSQYL